MIEEIQPDRPVLSPTEAGPTLEAALMELREAYERLVECVSAGEWEPQARKRVERATSVVYSAIEEARRGR